MAHSYHVPLRLREIVEEEREWPGEWSMYSTLLNPADPSDRLREELVKMSDDYVRAAEALKASGPTEKKRSDEDADAQIREVLGKVKQFAQKQATYPMSQPGQWCGACVGRLLFAPAPSFTNDLRCRMFPHLDQYGDDDWLRGEPFLPRSTATAFIGCAMEEKSYRIHHALGQQPRPQGPVPKHSMSPELSLVCQRLVYKFMQYPYGRPGEAWDDAINRVRKEIRDIIRDVYVRPFRPGTQEIDTDQLKSLPLIQRSAPGDRMVARMAQAYYLGTATDDLAERFCSIDPVLDSFYTHKSAIMLAGRLVNVVDIGTLWDSD